MLIFGKFESILFFKVCLVENYKYVIEHFLNLLEIASHGAVSR